MSKTEEEIRETNRKINQRGKWIIGIIIGIIALLCLWMLYESSDNTYSSNYNYSSDKCSMCHGTGTIYEDGVKVKCPTCMGTGKNFAK